MELIRDINPRQVASAYVEAPFDEGKNALESEGFHVVSLEENAMLRMQEGKDAFVSQNGNWVLEGVIYVPKKGAFLTKKSPIMPSAEQATTCHRNGKEFYITPKQVKEALLDSVKLSKGSIPTKKFADDEVASFAFGKSAEAYGNFLNEAGVDEMPVYLADLEKKPFARQAWLRGLDNQSELGGYRVLDYGDRVRGVRSVSAAGTAKISPDLDSKIQTALDQGKAFEFNGTMYVPTNGKGISLEQ